MCRKRKFTPWEKGCGQVTQARGQRPGIAQCLTGGRRPVWRGLEAMPDPPILASFPLQGARTDAGVNERAVTLGPTGRQDWALWT